ncbi:hypothetical protein OOK13_21055 [Streptomyces sp. NBC_00378]|uniref:hypothetical protein n=1 Tax=Streptomyces sp. NBC_00378 TaxID=2975732 RepID=UPI00225044DE|nr:hypothetical protein [Streptomyces sp. NBC_00378]MCX5110989.1 hypothetical protein [Streptomyces sp. NBC_00378]
MDHPTQAFIDRINRGPAGLLLGQSHLRLGGLDDPLLSLAQMKLRGSGNGYDVLLTTSEAGPGFADWLEERCRQLAPSEHLDSISDYPWVGVWSSAIDSIWPSVFEKPWREVQRIFSERYKPTDPRNRRRLHCTYLYGCTARTEPDERFPASRIEKLKRRTVANALAYRMVEALGPLGTLAIDGYTADDWLTVEDLAGLVLQLESGQCHLFSVTDDLLKHPMLAELAGDGHLVVHNQPLALVLEEGLSAGLIATDPLVEQGDLQRLVSFSDGNHSVPRDLWVPLSSNAQLLSEAVLVTPAPVSADARYSAFRHFLGASPASVNWEGIGRGFAFHRDFERRIEEGVLNRAARREISDRPLVLHGGTGTGKSVALASVAYALASRRRYPVIHLGQSVGTSALPALDAFCQWAEREGADSTVVIWDAMRDMDWYADVARRFSGRGRRVVLVGSSYRIDVGKIPSKRRKDYIEAPAVLMADEPRRMAAFLTKLDESLAQIIERKLNREASFLAFLYRLLPPARATVRRGVVQELEQVERNLVKRVAQTETRDSPKTALGYAMLKAGLIPQLPLASKANKSTDADNFTVAEELTALVMVAGQFGLSVPLELLIRATGRPGYFNVARLFDEADLVRWEEDHEGNFRLGARSRLEAQLIVSSRLGTTARELDYALRLIVEARGSEDAISGAREIDFVADLVRAMGAQGPDPARYRKEFPLISNALRELREERGLENPRLMLQEANLLREFAIWARNSYHSDESTYSPPPADVALRTATDVLHIALTQFRADALSPLKSKLRVELASTYAAQAQIMRGEHRTAEQVDFFERAKHELALAREEEQDSFYPLDVLAWSTRDVLSSLSDEDRPEAIVDVLSAFEALSPEDLDPSQIQNYHRRRLEFATEANNLTLADEAFQALIERGSGAGVYLRARAIASTPANGALDSSAHQRISRALAYLDTYEELVSGDSRCLNLRLNLWWLHNTGNRLFGHERERLPFDQEQWQEAHRLIVAIEDAGPNYRDIPLTFIRGIAEFHRGDLGAAFSTFSDLETRSDEVRGRRRIIRSYLASDSHGNPQLFSGEIARISGDLRRGEVYVENLRRRVKFIPSEFKGRELKSGANLGNFHIGFNLLGIIADPESFLHPRRQER